MNIEKKKLFIRIVATFLVFVIMLPLLAKFGMSLFNKEEATKWMTDKIKLLNPKIAEGILKFGWQLPFAAFLSWGFYKKYSKDIADRLTNKALAEYTIFRAGKIEIKNKLTGLTQYYHDFSAELKVAQNFFGREEIFSFLENFQKSNACGYVRLTASAGLGKSALAAAVASRFDAPGFFASAYRGTTEASVCLNHLSVVFIAQHSLPIDHLDLRSGENSVFFENILLQCAQESNGKPIWFVVDGLDEAAEAKQGNTLMLPTRLPPGVFAFVTQRPGQYPLLTDPSTPIADYEITWDSPFQQNAIEHVIVARLKNPLAAKALQKLKPPRTVESFASMLHEMSEGNFMFLSYLFADLERGDFHFLDEAHPVKNLGGYYEIIWKQIESKSNQQDLWKSLYRPVIGLLAAAREPVSLAWISDVSRISKTELRERALRDWERFLRKDGRGEKEQWSIIHRSFGDFIAAKIDITEMHALIGSYFLKTANWPSHDRYAVRHLTTHLRLGGNRQLFELLQNSAFFEQQISFDRTGMMFESDLDNGVRLAEKINEDEIRRGGKASCIDEGVRFALEKYTLKSYWENFLPSSLKALLQAKILKDSEAYDLAIRSSEPSPNSYRLSAIAPVIDQRFILPAVDVAESFDDPEHTCRVLIALYKRLPANDQLTLQNKLQTYSRAIEDPSLRIETMLNIAEELSGPAKDQMMEEALESVQKIEDGDEDSSYLIALAENLKKPELIADAEKAARKIDDPEQKISKLIELIPVIESGKKSSLANEIIGLLKNSEIENSIKADLFSSLIATSTTALVNPIVEEALLFIKQINEPELKAALLVTASDSVEEPQRSALLKESETYTIQTESIEEKCKNFARLAEKIPEKENEFSEKIVSILREGFGNDFQEKANAILDVLPLSKKKLKNDLLEEALLAVRKINDPIRKSRLLIKLGNEFENEQQAVIFKEIADIPGGILVIGGLRHDEVERIELLGSLANETTGDVKKYITDEALRMAKLLTKPYERARVFLHLMNLLEQDQRPPLIDEILVSVKQMSDPEKAVQLLTGVVGFVDESEKKSLFELAEKTAEEITNQISITGTFAMETGVVELDYVPDEIYQTKAMAFLKIAECNIEPEKTRLIDKAYDAFFDLTERVQRNILKHFFAFLSGERSIEIVHKYRSVKNDKFQLGFYQGLLAKRQPDLAGEENDHEQETIEDQETNSGDSMTFQLQSLNINNFFRLYREPEMYHVTITGAGDMNQDSMADLHYKIGYNIVDEVIRQAGLTDIDVLEEDGKNIMTGMVWNEPLKKIFEQLVRLDSSENTLHEARQIWTDFFPANVVGVFKKYFSTDDFMREVAKAYSTIENKGDDLDKLIQYVGVIAHLTDDETRDQCSSRLLELFSKTIQESVNSSEILEAALDLKNEPAALQLRVVQIFLDQATNRKDFLAYVRQLLPLILGLGEQGTARQIADAVIQNSNKWS
ncbi:MAG: hypothetical protein JST75_14240 [Bacteroidetes bacterium]|nr:hypothetical protein [Bacteroidota bacterium]